MIAAHGIHKRFGTLPVLRGVDLVVAERELVFVIGPSGSGKSTLLRCLNRLETPDSGSLVVAGMDLLDRRTNLNHARRRIGMVFQSFNLYPQMTARGNVALALRKVVGLPRAEADAQDRESDGQHHGLEPDRREIGVEESGAETRHLGPGVERRHMQVGHREARQAEGEDRAPEARVESMRITVFYCP